MSKPEEFSVDACFKIYCEANKIPESDRHREMFVAGLKCFKGFMDFITRRVASGDTPIATSVAAVDMMRAAVEQAHLEYHPEPNHQRN